jgi:Amiloride-sensitive sodium channel
MESFEQLSALNLIEKNFVQLNIGLLFDRINPYLMVDTPSMMVDNLSAQLGGVLSLWLGFTIMTVVDLIELFYTLLQQALNARKGMIKEPTQGMQANESTDL